jgi:hypothetical protein
MGQAMSFEGNGFGRRPNIREELAGRINTRGTSAIGGVAFGIAIVLAVMTFYVVSMKSAGRALNNSWTQNAGYPALDNPPVQRADAGTPYSELRTACKRRAEKVQLSRATSLELDYHVNIRVGERQLDQHVAFIDCLITETPARFCRPEHRVHLVEAVRSYFRLRMRVREEWAMARNNPFGAHAAGLMPLPGAHGVTTRFPSQQTDARIVTGLAGLIANGYLTPADLGAGLFSRMPGDLGELLKDAARKTNRCG